MVAASSTEWYFINEKTFQSMSSLCLTAIKSRGGTESSFPSYRGAPGGRAARHSACNERFYDCLIRFKGFGMSSRVSVTHIKDSVHI